MCKRSDALSRPVLMVRGLDGYFDPPLPAKRLVRVAGGHAVQFSSFGEGGGRAFGSPPTRPISVVIARGPHLFPFRTEQLSPSAPMVLGPRGPGRVGRRRYFHRAAPRGAALLRSGPSVH